MDNLTARDYLPVDLLGIGSTPLILLCVAAAVVVIGFVASGLMAFHFKTAPIKAIIVLLATIVASSVMGWFAFDAYQKTAAVNLAENVSYKYPELKLMSPEKVIGEYITLKDSESNAPLEVTVFQGQEQFTYRIDSSNGLREPVLTPADGSDAPNPIQFIRSGEAR